ncbi:DUF4352 domain-containing protein [Streptococcus mutans]|uniref:DUF4352 domain-containing protein n=1 Tax=Streptococcus mutans TaxID=1309 RepID=UPI001455BCE9|nr:DUF4352 domain-containing protein [Streptococcus mutans]NLQ82709.1 DUF4352 domain-containing protein [Streptococcus mutans]
MENKTNVWKVLGIIFIVTASIFFIATIVMTALYATSRQDFNKWTATNSMQDRTITNKKKAIKNLKIREKIRDNYYGDDYESTDKVTKYIFGESARMSTGEEVTVTGVKEDSKVKMKGVSKKDKKIVLTVSVKNTTDKMIQFSPDDFFIYDRNYDIAEPSNYTGKQKIPDIIEAGKTIEVKLYYTIPKSSPYIVNFENAYWIPQTQTQKKSRTV